MQTGLTCPECGAALPASAPEGLCPRCLAGMALRLGVAFARPSGPGETELVVSVTEKSGDRIGRYKLLQQIGEGGCGIVYLAEQEEPVRRRVALKVIKLGMDTKQVIGRFEAERQALALMDHPNIAKVLDGGATETGRPYFVMDFVRGVRITDYCDRNNLPTPERLKLFMEVCHAVQHAHQKGITHRDIKPSNILVTLHDGVPMPKVIDFGIAKATEGRLTDKTLSTRLHSFLGTPAYMSPEQAEMTGLDVDTRSDIYSLGVLLYELLTGTTPFEAKELFASGLDEMRRTIREKDPIRPSTRLTTTLDSDLSQLAQDRGTEAPKLIHLLRRDLDWIVMKCLEKDRTHRYQTANGLAMDIQRHLNNEPVVARPPSKIYRLQKLMRRNKLAFAATAAIAAALLAGTVLSTWQAVRARRAERHAREEAIRAGEEAARAVRAQKAADIQGEARRLLEYVTDINLAQRYCEEANFAQASYLLTSHLPKEDGIDRRGFEWRYLYRLCRGNYALALPKHEQVLGSLEFSPNGRMLATYCWDRKLRLWNIDSQSKQPLFNTAKATGLGGFTADGEGLVFGSIGGLIQRYDIASGKVSNLLEHAGEIVAFSAPADIVVTISTDNRLHVWDLATRRLRFSMPGLPRYLEFGWTERTAIAPNGKVLAIVESEEGPEALRMDLGIRLWDLSTGKELGMLKENRQIRSLKFSPDAALLAVGDGKGIVNLWDLATQQFRTIAAHELPVSALAFSFDNRTLATGSSDETIKLWDPATGLQLTNRLRGQIGAVSALAFSPDGKHLASGSRSATVKIWNPDQSEKTEEIRGLHSRDYGNFAFSPDGKTMAAGCEDNTVKVWDMETLNVVVTLPRLMFVVAFTSDSKYLLASTLSGSAFWCDIETNSRRPLPGYSGNLKRVICVDLSPDRRIAALGHDDGTIQLLEVDSGKPLGLLQAHTDRVRTVSFSPDGRTLASGGSDHCVKLWDVERQIKLGEKEEHKGAVCAAVISHDGERLASGCGAGTLKLWNPANLTNSLVTIPCHKSAVRALDFSHDGRTLASGAEDRSVKLWNLASLLTLPAQREVASFALSDKVRLVKFSPNDDLLVIISDDGVLRVLRAMALMEIDEELAGIKQ